MAVDGVTDLWEDADFQQLTAQGAEAAEVIREYLERELLARLVEFLGGRDATARATDAVTILGGLICTRHLSPLPTPAALTPSEARHVPVPALRAAPVPRPRTAATKRVEVPVRLTVGPGGRDPVIAGAQ